MNGVAVPKYGGSESEQPPTIYTVPSELRSANVEAYLPVAVEIGLVHQRWANPDFELLQDYKWCCVRRLISRHHLLQESSRTRTLLRRCLAALKSLEPRIWASYPRNVNRQDRDLVHTMLLDGCFILHRLLKYARIARREAASSASASATAEGGNDDDEGDDDCSQVFGRCWVWGFVTRDLLLLENQIPFFVVEKLFEQLRTDPNETSEVLVAGALRLFRSLRPQNLHASPITCVNVHHLLHLFYLSVGKPAPAPAPAFDLHQHVQPPSEFTQWVPCARELEEAGVKFRARQDATSFLDMEFHGGVLEIPMLQLYDYSEPLLRNLIAFEQTYPFTPGNVTAYAIFMDCLVASPEDMRLLQLSGVLVNQMNSERDREAARFFGRLCHETYLAADRNYLAGVITELNKYQRARWPRWRAALVRNYFSNPWVTTSVAAAVVLLVLTTLQSFFAAYAYFKPPKQQ
ncbi:UPF0481 protein At3g47200-like [Phragmites australis]|uniref:UPF0481 protein At3g47200-like n=1 Tax=Phragmites australis TaxID=29695 RepID=UPI002D789980|nr:UPF0481 protein At3g47200-like [Phragmites australis]